VSPVLDFERFAVRMALAAEREPAVPLLVLRLPDVLETAWRRGRRAARSIEVRTLAAFRTAATRIVRDGDLLAHSEGSDRFAVGMTTPPRHGRSPSCAEIRSTLERIAAAVSLSTGHRMETGWCQIGARAEAEAIGHALDVALERGMRERDRHALLATVGHELRTPLTSIRGYLETLLDGEEVDSQTARRFLETARREALRLGRLVDGMLEFSMLDLSVGTGRCCDAVEQIHATVDALEPLARERRIGLQVELPRAAAARIDGDACMHVLLNVVENALKHGRPGGRVVIGCEREGPYLCVTVDDDGPGVPPQQRTAVFAMGVRASTTGPPGRGIGLAIVKSILERSGGNATVSQSALGGARFELRFPYAGAEAIEPATS
jgi:signal transduction histidine kinase